MINSAMNKWVVTTGILTIFFLGFVRVEAQNITKKNYQRAEKFLFKNVDRLVFRINVHPHWAKDKPLFWYRVHTHRGEEYFLVDAYKKTKQPFFDEEKLAHKLSIVMDKKIDPYDLPINYLNWNSKDNTFQFHHNDKTWKVNLENLKVTKVQNKNDNDRLTSTSPNGKWTVIRKNYNLYLKNNETGDKNKFTKDGKKHFIYGANLPWAWERQVGSTISKRKPLPLHVSWSKDSQKFYVGKLDLRKAKKMYLLQDVPKKGLRAKVFSYYRALPGDDSVAKVTPYVFSIKNKKKTRLQVPPYAQLVGSRWIWSGSKLYGILRTRGHGAVTLVKANLATGTVDTLFHRTSKTYIDPLNNEFKFLPKSNELIWLSERSGWNQIYLYNLQTGKLKNRVTHGKYVVRHLVNVDSKNRTIYFTACGRISGQDPYYLHFYRVNFDGSNFKLLTPENATHNIFLSSGHKFFVDRYSRVNQPPKSVLRSIKDGSVLMTLEHGNIKKLRATGWQYPQQFKLKARDDSTNIYGVIFRPSNFDSNKKYPVIDNIYAGPQTVITPKSFSGGLFNSDQSLAELGFIVIKVDGLGTAERSKKFHDFSYKNLADASLPDHIKAIKYLAKKHSYIDTSRVGIWGHSAGGYDAARAMLAYPNFFKVGVAESGDHDLRLAKAWWPELYMGYPAGPQYANQTNMKLADNLKGYLLLAHGNMDTNVHPDETYRLDKALIDAGKSFDLVIIPNVAHGYGYASAWFTVRRWNYFINHLMDAQPIRNYKIGQKN